MRKPKRPPGKATRGKTPTLVSQTNALSAEDRSVWNALEEARQSVKPAVKRQMEGEIINQDLLNFRLRGGIGGVSSPRA